MTFVRFLGLAWPEEAPGLLQVSVLDVQRFREALVELGAANKTLNRRICSLSAFYKYLGLSAAELRLPINLPNPANAQFVKRAKPDARKETKALSLARVRQLLALPQGHDVLAARDWAILSFYLYSGARIAAGCKLTAADLHYDREDSTIRLQQKGGEYRTIGLHFVAAEALREYLDQAGVTLGGTLPPTRAFPLPALGRYAHGRIYDVSAADGLLGEVARSDGRPPRSAGQGGARLHLQPALRPRFVRHVVARCRRRYPRSAGTAQPQAHHHLARHGAIEVCGKGSHPDLRQTPPHHPRERVA